MSKTIWPGLGREAVGPGTMWPLLGRWPKGARATHDILGTHDAATRRIFGSSSTSDSIGTSDVARRVVRPTRAATDSIGTSDLALGTSTRNGANDSLGTSDSAVRVAATTLNGTETMGTSDRAVALQRRTTSDALGTSDTAARTYFGPRTASDVAHAAYDPTTLGSTDAYWPLDDVGTTTLRDAGSGGYAGVYSGLSSGAFRVAGPNGAYAVQFPASPGHAQVNDSSGVPLPATYSMVTWFRVEGDGSTGFKTIINRGGTGAQKLYYIVDPSDLLYHNFELPGVPGITRNVWHMLAFSYDVATGNENVWLDGALVYSGATGFGAGYADTAFNIGSAGGSNHAFEGKLARFSWHDGILTDATVAALWGVGAGIPDVATRALSTVKTTSDSLGTHDSATQFQNRSASDTLNTSDAAVRTYLGPRTTSDTAGWSPTQLAGLQGWWKPDGLALANGASVTTWPDSSGHGHDLTVPGGAGTPSFVTNLLNGKGGVRFTAGSSTALSGSFLSSAESGLWFFIVFTERTGVGSFAGVIGTTGGGSDDFTAGAVFANGNSAPGAFNYAGIEGVKGGTNTDLMTSSRSFGTFAEVALDYYNATTSTLYVNGTAEGTRGASAATVDARTIMLGARFFGGGFTRFNDIDVVEVLALNQDVSSTDRQRLFTYLGEQYQLSAGNDAATH